MDTVTIVVIIGGIAQFGIFLTVIIGAYVRMSSQLAIIEANQIEQRKDIDTIHGRVSNNNSRVSNLETKGSRLLEKVEQLEKWKVLVEDRFFNGKH